MPKVKLFFLLGFRQKMQTEQSLIFHFLADSDAEPRMRELVKQNDLNGAFF